MRKRHVMFVMGLGFCSAISGLDIAPAQIPVPAAKLPDGTARLKHAPPLYLKELN
jgi:hypothetical protein